MYYSSVSLLALIIHFIINHEALKKNSSYAGLHEEKQTVNLRYRYFLIAVSLYFIADVAWGILYEHHDIPALFIFIYSDTIFYFVFMLLTMITWIRYIVAYLNSKGRKSKMLLYAAWAIFTLALVYLMINRFYPFIFSFNEAHEYIMEPGRYIAFILQIALYMATSSYVLYIAFKSSGSERSRYAAVGFTTFTIELFQILQIFSPIFPFYAIGLMIGTCIIHSYVEAGERKEKEIFDHIATSLAEDYEAMYYIDIQTGEYIEFSKSEQYASMNVPTAGRDFFAETRENALKYAHPDDKEFAQSLYYKDLMLQNLDGRKSYSYKYRIMVNNMPRYFRFTVMRAYDEKHLVLYVKDIDEEITAESMRLERHKVHVTFTQIAESLASNYDVIYYIDVQNADYVGYEFNNIYGQLEVQKSGSDFYSETIKDIPRIIHKNDQEMVTAFLAKKHLIAEMEHHKVRSIEYRLVINGKPQYTRLTVHKSSDGTHFIIGIENIDAEVRKEKKQLKALNTEKELARRDELTGIKNKTAYLELEQSVQSNIDKGLDYLSFAIIVCDANNLKKINDTEGHVAGDEYLKASAKLLCDTFVHSPVFRVGGDEFVVFLRGNDYLNRLELFEKLRADVLNNQKSNSGPVLASGISEYHPKTDSLVSEIFDRADKEMYVNKQYLKSLPASSAGE